VLRKEKLKGENVMKLPDYMIPGKSPGMGTTGTVGCIILAGVIWGQLSPWWLMLSTFFILSAIGTENGRR